MREMKIQQGHRKEGRNEGIDENMKEVLIKLYKTSLDTTLLIIYNLTYFSSVSHLQAEYTIAV